MKAIRLAPALPVAIIVFAACLLACLSLCACSGDESGTRTRETDVTVSYSANGGHGHMDDSVVLDGKSFTYPACAFERDGYEFAGWALKSGSNGVERHMAGEVVLGFSTDGALQWRHVRLYATWRKVQDSRGLDDGLAPGSYRVGSEIRSGRYWLLCDGSGAGRIRVVDIASHGREERSRELFDKSSYISVHDGETLEFEHAHAWRASSHCAVAVEANILAGDGTYLCGVDFPAGKWEISRSDDPVGVGRGRWCVYASAAVDARDVRGGLVESRDTVTLSKGEYLCLSGCYADRVG